MTIVEILLLSISLCADSFAVSMSASVTAGRPSLKKTLSIASVFGVVQALFLFCGWAAGNSLVSYVEQISHFIALAILAYIGVTMIVSGVRKTEDEGIDLSGFKRLFAAAVATSIDAVAIGISLAMGSTDMDTAIVLTLSVLIVTMLASMTGVHVGAAAGRKFGHAAKIVGGIVLIFIGCKPFLGL